MSDSTSETSEVVEPEDTSEATTNEDTSEDTTTEEPTVKGDGTTVKPDNYSTP